MYMVRKGRPYIWVPEKDLHNVVWSSLNISATFLGRERTTKLLNLFFEAPITLKPGLTDFN